MKTLMSCNDRICRESVRPEALEGRVARQAHHERHDRSFDALRTGGSERNDAHHERNYRTECFGPLLVFLSGLAACGAAHAELLVPKAAKGTLSVQYEYSAIGARKDKYEPAEWRVLRTINLIVPMTADPPAAVSALRGMDAAYAADMEKKKTQIEDLHKTLAPTMTDIMKIAERCNESEACIEKAIQEYGETMDMATIDKGKSQAAAASTMAGSRYQLWKPVSQKGTYLVDETYRAQTADPLCMNKAKQRCVREETRKGGGDIPSPSGGKNTSAALLEVDSVNKGVLIKLPIPLSELGYTRRINSDFPDEASGTSSSALPSMLGQQRSVTATIPGDLRSASGTQSFKLDGEGAEGGTLVVTWQFAAE